MKGVSPAVARALPFGVFIALMVAEPYLASMVEPWMDPRWLYGIRSLVTALVLVALWRHYVELRGAGEGERDGAHDHRPPVMAWLVGVGVGVGVFLFWIVLDFPPLVFDTSEREAFTPLVAGQIHLGFAMTRLAGSALVVPVMEELFWRSFIMRWLEKPKFMDVSPSNVGWKALVISSVVFALEHSLWFAGLLAGLIYGELYRRTRSLWVVILAHAVTNGLLGLYVLWSGEWQFW